MIYFDDNYYDSQLEAINNFYLSLTEYYEYRVSLTEAIITWFAEGHAEKFREEYLEKQRAVTRYDLVN